MNYLIVLVTVIMAYASFKLFKRAAGNLSLSKFNTVSYVFYVQILTSGLVGSVLLATNSVDYHPDVQGISDSVKIESWLWVMYSIVALPIAMLALNKIVNVNAPIDYREYLKKEIEIPGTVSQNRTLIVLMIGFSTLVLGYIFYYTEKIALFTLLIDGNAEQAAIDRVAARREFHGISHIKNLLGSIMIPVFTFYTYILYRKVKDNFIGVGFLIMFFLSILLMTYDTQKAPVAFFILGFFIIEVIIENGVKLKKLFFFIGLPIFLIVIGYSLTNDKSFASQLLSFNSSFYGRIFLTSYYAFPLSLEYFPYHITEPTYAIGIPNAIIESLDLNPVESARLLKAYVHPEKVANGTGNLYSGYYMGEAWANYGYLGLVLAPILVGFIVQSVHLFLLKSVKSPLVIAFYAVITFKWLLSSGFSNFLYLKIIIWPLILFIIFNFLIKRFVK